MRYYVFSLAIALTGCVTETFEYSGPLSDAGGTRDMPGEPDTGLPDDDASTIDAGGPADAEADAGPGVCGDGMVNPGEDCDEGVGGVPTDTFDCDADCTSPLCGDFYVNFARMEECDVGGIETATCDADCTFRVCGDGVIDAAAAEQCDNFGGGDSSTCDSDCTVPFCGDMHTNPTTSPAEECDDGNASNLDNCTNLCNDAVCGDGFLDSAPPNVEGCDDGNTVTETGCPYGTPTCVACSSTCSTISLTGPLCGDGITNGPEACDDGNTSNNDACLNTCQNASCGDGFVRAGVEQCDDTNTSNTDACLNTCQSATCGDGFIRTGFEGCDDGNTSTTDNCPSGPTGTCQPADCGDGFTDTLAPGIEQCDDGNASNTDACLTTCLNAVCGDGFIRAGVESCDDHNASSCGTCNASCTTSISLVGATGTIQNLTGSQYLEGETFTVHDGINGPVIFEFDPAGNGVAAGRVLVVTPAGSGAGMMADNVTAAINGVGSALRITSSHLSGPNANLVHDVAGAHGNQSMSETVLQSGFVVTGMSGGVGGNCNAGVGCNTAQDCNPALACVANTCM